MALMKQISTALQQAHSPEDFINLLDQRLSHDNKVTALLLAYPDMTQKEAERIVKHATKKRRPRSPRADSH